MYHILIVDDEKIERNGIVFLLNRLGIELKISQAANGQAALDLLKGVKQGRKEPVDILLTDVKMPFMDGIELIQATQGIGLKIKTIIFSGYNEFEYAKLAVKLGVSDYILKPVNPQEFEATIRKVIGELEEEQKQKVKQDQRDDYMREYLLYSLLNHADPVRIKEQAGMLINASFWNRYHRMMLLEFNQDFFGKVVTDFEAEVLQEILPDCQYLNLNQQQAVVLFQEKDIHHAMELAERLHGRINTRFDYQCYIAVSGMIDDYEELPGQMEQLEQLLENKFYDTDTYLYSEQLEESGEQQENLDDDRLFHQMQTDIRNRDVTGLKWHYGRICQKYRKKSAFSHIYIKFIFSNILKELYEALPSMEEERLNKEVDRLYRASDLDTVMEIVDAGIDDWQKKFRVNPQREHKEIEIVKQYIFTHYRQEIGVEGLASMVYLAPSYLSMVFKKETGENLSKYIKRYRMEKARDMLENSNKKIVDISNEVGYPNVSYFCQSFRECFGMSPQKFRVNGKVAYGEEE